MILQVRLTIFISKSHLLPFLWLTPLLNKMRLLLIKNSSVIITHPQSQWIAMLRLSLDLRITTTKGNLSMHLQIIQLFKAPQIRVTIYHRTVVLSKRIVPKSYTIGLLHKTLRNRAHSTSTRVLTNLHLVDSTWQLPFNRILSLIIVIVGLKNQLIIHLVLKTLSIGTNSLIKTCTTLLKLRSLSLIQLLHKDNMVNNLPNTSHPISHIQVDCSQLFLVFNNILSSLNPTNRVLMGIILVHSLLTTLTQCKTLGDTILCMVQILINKVIVKDTIHIPTTKVIWKYSHSKTLIIEVHQSIRPNIINKMLWVISIEVCLTIISLVGITDIIIIINRTISKVVAMLIALVMSSYSRWT